MAICISNAEQRTDFVTKTLAKLGSLLVKRLAKPYKDFMLSLVAEKSVLHLLTTGILSHSRRKKVLLSIHFAHDVLQQCKQLL